MPLFQIDHTNRWIRVAAVVALTATGGCHPAERESMTDLQPDGPQRIVSLAPSVTEVVKDLGLGHRLVGVTRYCNVSSSMRDAVDVGGYLDVNLEGLVGLRPDLVIVIQDHGALRDRLGSLGLNTLQVDQGSMGGILQSVVDIADACGVPERGASLVADLEARLHRVALVTSGLDPPTTLVVVGRDLGTGAVTNVWVAGRSTFYNDVLQLAGGLNAMGPSAVAYPEVSREGLLHLDPDVILDLLADLGDRRIDVETARADWRFLGSMRAVKEGRLIAVEEPSAVVPGPGVVDLVERVARLLHPEAEW